MFDAILAVTRALASDPNLAQPKLRFIAGRWHNVWPDGRALPVIAGADGPATLAPLNELLARRDALLEQLNDPSFSGDHDELMAEADQVATDIAEHERRNGEAAQRRQRLMGAGGGQALPPGGAGGAGGNGVTFPLGGRADVPDTVPSDWAQQFVESEAFRNFRANAYKGRAGVDIDGVDIRSILNGLAVRAPLDNTATSAGAFQNPARPAMVPMTNADRPLRLADLLDRQTTGNNTVEYVRETTAAGAGAAAEVAEGGAKPEAGYTFEVVTDSVRTIAHWVQITRQAADDNQQLMGHIRGRLTYGLEFRLDAQIINGNGVGTNLRGILNTSGINTHAPIAAEARVISIRRAMTLVQIDEYAATGVVLHPTDWELVELSTDNDGMFRVSPSVANALAPRIWGLSVVSTTAIASGTGLVGDFRMGATLWDRQQPQVFITDSHASTFTSNILTLLAELRAALSVWRPSAFAKITFNGAV